MANWSENAKKILEARYLFRDKQGIIKETPDGMLERVAAAIALAEMGKSQEYWKDKFLSIMDSLEFLPNTPTLINGGRELGQLAACFVLPLGDSLESIFEAVKQSAIIHKSGGGTGFNFSLLRPTGAMVNSTAGIASGPVSFLRAFDVVTDIVKQGGVRRGANIGILNCSHPDIIEFIDCKKDRKSFQNFNISVGLVGNFLEHVKNDAEISLNFRGFPFKSKIRARDIFKRLCYNVWENGEPGVLFFDTINKFNPIPFMGRIYATNPCAEAPLLAYESCNLGSLNLTKFLKGKTFDWNRLQEVVGIAIRFLDDVIDVNKYPRIQIARKTRLTRKVGLGIMGLADILGEFSIQYDSEEALKFIAKLMDIIRISAYSASHKIGLEKGYCFNNLKRRNSCLLSIAPTGSISILAGCSNGIEPLYAKNYTRKVLNGVSLEFAAEYSAKTAMEISPEWHVRVQAEIQKYVDQGVSKTINLSFEATIEDVSNAIFLAYSLGCKGLALYRQGTRDAPYQTIDLSECADDKCLI